MGGSGGTFSGPGRSPSDHAEKLRRAAESSALEFEVELAKEFNEFLLKFNSRNTAETQERLQEIKDALHDSLDSSFDTLFGGSVAKHTYVDGISDIDSMLVVSGPLEDANPQQVLNKVANVIRSALDPSIQVGVGNVAISVSYPDGSQIQLIPSIRVGEKLQVPAWESNVWSTINPRQFTDGLRKRNDECGGKLIPTLKLAKAINATLPESARLSGYHMESLGVAAFRGYDDERTTVRMLPHFFKRASELVLRPMVDRTGQSVHVDEHLGPENSPARLAMSHMLSRMHQRMVNASAAKSRDRWRDFFDE